MKTEVYLVNKVEGHINIIYDRLDSLQTKMNILVIINIIFGIAIIYLLLKG